MQHNGMQAEPLPSASQAAPLFPLEMVSVTELKPHPRNYRAHPEDQLAHISQSMREVQRLTQSPNGFYRNIVIAADGTILAGHGVVQAAQKEGIAEVPVIRLPIWPDDPRALKILTGDNEISKLAEIDDRELTELLKLVKETDEAGLLGTGFDESMLAALTFITRPASEISTFDAAAEWVGMPAYDEGEKPLQLVISFRNDEDRQTFVEQNALVIMGRVRKTWSTWWPAKEVNDAAAVKFEPGVAACPGETPGERPEEQEEEGGNDVLPD